MIDILECKKVEFFEVKDFYNFLFFDGVFLDENNKYLGGVLNMGKKRACFSILIRGNRFQKDLKIKGIEGAFFYNVFLGLEDTVLIPFSSMGAKHGIEIDIFFYVQLVNENFLEGFKRIEIRNFYTAGGALKIKDLFFVAMQPPQDSPVDVAEKIIKEQATKDREKKVFKPSVLDSDFVEYNELRYKVSKMENGAFLVENITNGSKLIKSTSPKGLQIINLSKFKE